MRVPEPRTHGGPCHLPQTSNVANATQGGTPCDNPTMRSCYREPINCSVAPNSPAWLFVLWNITFPLAIIVYGLSKDRNGVATLPGRSTSNSIGITVACVLVVVAGLTWVVTTKAQYLASLYTTNITLQTQFAMLTDLALWAWGGTALAVLLARRRTILDLWLMVTLLAWMPNFLLALIANPLRFTIGWYAARCFVLIGSCMLRTVLLVETVFLYSRLTSAIILQRRERINSLLSVDAVTASLAHELNTPLAAIALNASTAISELHSSPLDLKELDEILKDIEAEGHRAGAIISSVRQLSKKTTNRTTSTRVEDVVRLVLRLLQHDLQISEVSVATQFQGDLPEVHIDGTQLQQVLLNFIKNAIDAMNAVAPEARRLLMTTSCDGHSSVSLSVQDSGPGIPVEDQDRLFDQFFTTKSDGMGLGLAICLTVVERHGGKLQLVKSDSDGSIFEIEIPVTGRNLG